MDAERESAVETAKWAIWEEAAKLELPMVQADAEQLAEAVVNAYKAGAMDVHNNWQEDRDPDFTEAAHDYARAVLSSVKAEEKKS